MNPGWFKLVSYVPPRKWLKINVPDFRLSYDLRVAGGGQTAGRERLPRGWRPARWLASTFYETGDEGACPLG
jgi:hypothetical protein